jgi:hypothetical protein
MVVVLTAEAVSQRSRSQLTHNIVAWVLLTGASLLMLLHTDGRMHPFVTMEDRAFVLVSLVYIIASTAYWVYSIATILSYVEETNKVNDVTKSLNQDPGNVPKIPETQRDGVNAMIGSIHFATCVLYGTPDNAYVAGFFFSFLFRCMQKIYDARTVDCVSKQRAHHRPDIHCDDLCFWCITSLCRQQ